MLTFVKILFIMAAFRSAVNAVNSANAGHNGMCVMGCVMFFLFAGAAAFIDFVLVRF